MRFDRAAYGAQIKHLRLAKGFTQEQLTERLNVSNTCITKIENNQRTSSVELAVELAIQFDVSLDYLSLGAERDTKKQAFRTVISFLSELEAKL